LTYKQTKASANAELMRQCNMYNINQMQARAPLSNKAYNNYYVK